MKCVQKKAFCGSYKEILFAISLKTLFLHKMIINVDFYIKALWRLIHFEIKIFYAMMDFYHIALNKYFSSCYDLDILQRTSSWYLPSIVNCWKMLTMAIYKTECISQPVTFLKGFRYCIFLSVEQPIRMLLTQHLKNTSSRYKMGGEKHYKVKKFWKMWT